MAGAGIAEVISAGKQRAALIADDNRGVHDQDLMTVFGLPCDILLAMGAEKENDAERYISFCIAAAELIEATAPTKPRGGFKCLMSLYAQGCGRC